MALFVGALVIFVVAALAATVYTRERTFLEANLVRNGQNVTVTAARFMVEPYLQRDLEEMQSILVEGRTNGIFDYAMVMDHEGIYLAHSEIERRGRRIEADDLLVLASVVGPARSFSRFVDEVRQMGLAGKVRQTVFRTGSRRYLELAYPILLDGRFLGGIVRVGFATNPRIELVVQKTLTRLLALFVPVLLIGIGAGVFLAGRMVRPIGDVVGSVRRIASGDLEHRVPPSGPAELAILAESVNSMGAEIRQRLEEVREANEKLDRKVYELSVLFDVSRSMNFRSYSPDLLGYLMDMVLEALHASWGSLMMLDTKTDRLQVKVVRGAPFEGEKAVELEPGEGIAGEVITKGEPIIANLGADDPRFVPFKSQKGYERKINQLICVPLLAENTAIGVVNVVNKKDGSDFNENDLRLLTALASLAARSLENARLYDQAIRECKTGLFVPSYFEARLQDEVTISRRFKRSFSVLMLDLDHFKKVNDTHGHLVGDRVLIHLAEVIKHSLREDIDVACRFGGEEFALLLPETGKKGALTFGERLRARVERETSAPDMDLPAVTLSGGCATYPEDGEDHETLLERADQALYKAKEGGRNRIEAAPNA